MKKNIAVLFLIVGLAPFISSCSTKTETVVREVVIKQPVRTAPGVVEYVWEEPMVDVIDVPPGLDPEGVYYRPAHKSIVEIRQGRWKYAPKKQ